MQAFELGSEFKAAIQEYIEDYTGLPDEVTARIAGDATNATAISTHTSRTDNPHNTTKAQVGLPLVSNLAPIDYPVSTATASALNSLEEELQDNIDGKANTSHTHTPDDITGFDSRARMAMEYATGAPVSDLIDLRGVDASHVQDKQQRLVEELGINYRYDLEGTGTDDDDGIIEPDSGIGRWFKSSTGGAGNADTVGGFNASYLLSRENHTDQQPQSSVTNLVTDLAAKPSLGETSVNAYRGDRGKTAYDFSQETTGVSASTYGDATHVPQFTVDAKGRITAVTEVEVEGAGAAGYGGTSTTSRTIGTGSKTFTTQAGYAYNTGSRVRAVDSTGSTNSAMEGYVTSYTGTTLTLDVDYTQETGTIATWAFSIIGRQGESLEPKQYPANSSTTRTVGLGSVTFTTTQVAGSLAYQTGGRARASSAFDSDVWMEGLVTAYSGQDLTIFVDLINGSGSSSGWNISVAGEPGAGSGGGGGDSSSQRFYTLSFNNATADENFGISAGSTEAQFHASDTPSAIELAIKMLPEMATATVQVRGWVEPLAGSYTGSLSLFVDGPELSFASATTHTYSIFNGDGGDYTINGSATWASGISSAALQVLLQATGGDWDDVIVTGGGTSWGTPLHDATANSLTTGSVTSRTWAHTMGTGNGRYLLVSVVVGGFDVPTVTYGGVAMTLLRTMDRAYVFGLASPTVGTANVVATITNSLELAGTSTSATMVDLISGPQDVSSVYATAFSTSASLPITTVTDNCLLFETVAQQNGPSFTPTASQTARGSVAITYNSGTGLATSTKATTAPATYTETWALGANGNYGLSIIALRGASIQALYVVRFGVAAGSVSLGAMTGTNLTGSVTQAGGGTSADAAFISPGAYLQAATDTVVTIGGEIATIRGSLATVQL